MQYLHRFATAVHPYAAGLAIVFPILVLILLLAELSGEFGPETAPVDVDEARALAQLGILGTFVLGAAYAVLAAISRSESHAD